MKLHTYLLAALISISTTLVDVVAGGILGCALIISNELIDAIKKR